MKSRVIISAVIIILVLSFSNVLAEVPQMINYQGKLTNPSGALVDATVAMTFAIYQDSSGGTPLWTETHSSVVVEYGVLSVLLGEVTPIPGSVFNGALRYLGITVGGDSEMTPRKEIVSVGYSYRSAVADSVVGGGGGGLNCEDCDSRFVNNEEDNSITNNMIVDGTIFDPDISNYASIDPSKILGTAWTLANDGAGSGLDADLLDGLNSSDFLSTSSDYGRPGVSGTLYEGATTLSDKYVNVQGPDSVYISSSGTAFLGKASGSSGLDLFGIEGYADNSGIGWAVGGYFETSNSGSGTHYGVYAAGGSANNNPVTGVCGSGSNTSTGSAYGGNFTATQNGSGTHYGIKAEGQGTSSSTTYGSYNYAWNSSSGSVYAGYFSAVATGTGNKYGVFASAPTSNGHAGYFSGDVRITDSLVVLGGKSAAVKVDNGEYRLLYSQESPEVWFEDFGEGQLINGRTHIELDPLYLETVTISDQHPMKVFIQLRDNCEGTYVKTYSTGFDVFELQDGTSNAAFSYRVVAKRKGFENIRLNKMGGPTPEEVEAEQVKHRAELEQEDLERQLIRQ